MMHGNLNAIGLLACIIGTVAVLVFSSRQKPTLGRIVMAIVVAFLTYFFSMSFGNHRCDAGQPFTQMLVPSVCMMIVLLSVKSAWVRRTASIALAMAAFALAMHFVDLVHFDGYTGNPNAGSRARMHVLRDVNLYVASTTYEGSSLPEGWLGDFEPSVMKLDGRFRSWREILDLYPTALGAVHRADHVWHTWFTGIYRTESIPADVWFKGGTPGTDVSQLEVRPRDRGM